MFVCDVKCSWFSRCPLNWASQYSQKRIVPLHTTPLEKPLIPQSAMGPRSHLCCGDAGPAPAHTWRGLAGVWWFPVSVPVLVFHTSPSSNHSVWQSRQWGRTCGFWLLSPFAVCSSAFHSWSLHYWFSLITCAPTWHLLFTCCCSSSPLPSSPTAPLSNPLSLAQTNTNIQNHSCSLSQAVQLANCTALKFNSSCASTAHLYEQISLTTSFQHIFLSWSTNSVCQFFNISSPKIYRLYPLMILPSKFLSFLAFLPTCTKHILPFPVFLLFPVGRAVFIQAAMRDSFCIFPWQKAHTKTGHVWPQRTTMTRKSMNK